MGCGARWCGAENAGRNLPMDEKARFDDMGLGFEKFGSKVMDDARASFSFLPRSTARSARCSRRLRRARAGGRGRASERAGDDCDRPAAAALNARRRVDG